MAGIHVKEGKRASPSWTRSWSLRSTLAAGLFFTMKEEG
jgi:hypothetical protein